MRCVFGGKILKRKLGGGANTLPVSPIVWRGEIKPLMRKPIIAVVLPFMFLAACEKAEVRQDINKAATATEKAADKAVDATKKASDVVEQKSKEAVHAAAAATEKAAKKVKDASK